MASASKITGCSTELKSLYNLFVLKVFPSPGPITKTFFPFSLEKLNFSMIVPGSEFTIVN